jgi:uncharacterized membrane protein YvlD (DUF360 family)
MIWMINFLAGLILAAVLLRIVAAIVPGLDVDDMTAAFQAAVLIAIVQNLSLMIATAALPGSSEWVSLVFSCIATAISLAIAALVLRGVRIEGPLGVVLAGMLLPLLGVGVRYALRAARAAGLVDALTQMAG